MVLEPEDKASPRGRDVSATAARYACYDVFDTVLFRRVLDPTDVFRLLHGKLRERFPAQLASVGEDAFVSARHLAEVRAREGRQETTLSEIWDEMSWLIDEERDEAARIELETERDVLFPNDEICRDIAARRAKGDRIVFISDMYMPESFLQSVLTVHGIMQADDRIFVSSTHRKTKHGGDLFRHVIDELGGEPARFRMTGDNRHSDFRMPRSLGLKARRYTGHRLSNYEKRLKNIPGLRQFPRSILVGSVRSGRSRHGQRSSRLVTDFLGPASLLWAIWAIRRAEESGTERLFFMARDGFLPWLSAKSLHDAGFTRIVPRYLYASRYSLYFSSIRDVQTDLQWIFDQKGELSCGKLLRYLQLDPAKLCPELKAFVDRYPENAPLDDEGIDEFVTVLANSSCGSQVSDTAEQMRAAARAYFQQEGLIDGPPSAIVDIGWHLNIQSALQSLLPESPMRGLYLYLSETRRSAVEAGHAEAMIELNVAHPRITLRPSLWHHSTVAEHLFGMAPEGTCKGFRFDAEGEAVPVLQDMDDAEVDFKQAIGDEILRFAKEWGPHFMHGFTRSECCAEAFRALTDEYFENPTRESLRSIKDSIRKSEEALNDGTSALVTGFQLSDAKRAIDYIRRRDGDKGTAWLAAKFSLAPPPFNLGGHFIRKIRPYLG